MQDLQDDAADCQADADHQPEITQSETGPARQQGLVNLNLEDIAVTVSRSRSRSRRTSVT